MLRIFQGRLFESNLHLLHTKVSKQVLITQLLFSHTAFRRNEKILHFVLFDSKPALNGLVPFSKGLRDGCSKWISSARNLKTKLNPIAIVIKAIYEFL